MVNLLVVALLLTSCLADVVEISNFQLLCKKQDGSYIPMRRTFAAVGLTENGMGMRNDSTGQHNVFSYHKEIGRFYSNVDGILDNPAINFPDGREVEIWIELSCAKDLYLQDCPGVDNLCIASGKDHFSMALHYNNQRSLFKGGVYALATATHYDLVQSKADLNTMPMTIKEFCAIPDGMNLFCEFPRKTSEIHETNDKSFHDSDLNVDVDGNIANFSITFLCQKKDGSYIPLDDTTFWVKIYPKGEYGVYKTDTGYAMKTALNFMPRTKSNGTLDFVIPDRPDIKLFRKSALIMILECKDRSDRNSKYHTYTKYYEECIGAETGCRTIDTHKPFDLPINELTKFNGGYFALRAINRFDLVHSMADLSSDVLPMNVNGWVRD